MYRETNTRSIVKGISWRIVATGTTIIIVYLFFGRLDLAIAAGIIESLLKVFLYFIHEKGWQRIRFGKKKIEPFVLWFTGLPLSGKTTISNKVYEGLQKLHIPIEHIDSKDIRELIPDIGFSREERNQHIKRVGHLVSTLQNNSISTIASFVSPYVQSRNIIKEMTVNPIIVYIKADIKSCQERDYKGVYEKALSGELENFTGISDVYEEPINPDIIIDTDAISIDDAATKIVKFVKKKYIK